MVGQVMEAARAPKELAWCVYPRAAETAHHGVQWLPATLPVADWAGAEPHRSRMHRIVPAEDLPSRGVLELARVVAESFAVREPQVRHLRPPERAPAALARAVHEDAFGREAFGPWTRASLLYWFIRLLILTDGGSPRGAVRVRGDVLRQSIAMVDGEGRVLGGAFNEPMPADLGEPELRKGDPMLEAMIEYLWPVLEMLLAQDREAVAALNAAYPAFAAAMAAGRVGHHFMVARSDGLAKAHAFELVAASAERYRELGFAYMVVEASNTWTGAACETLGGVRVHFAPYRAARAAPATPAPLPDATTSPDGFLSAKDAGCMFYVLRLE